MKTEKMNQRIMMPMLPAIAIVGALLYALHPILLPFVIGILTAYFLDPLVNKLTAHNFSRNAATSLVLGGILIIVVPLFERSDCVANFCFCQ